MDGEQLAGSMGNGGNVYRRGEVVIRPLGPHSEATNQLLQALELTPFVAPVPVGVAAGVQEFRWIDGDVAVPPFPRWVLSDGALASAGRLLRTYHETVAQLEFPPDLDWSREGVVDPQGGPVICHNDVCPENVVYRDGQAIALLDFDFAAPGRPVWDLAHMARMWAPMRPPDLVAEGMVGLDPFHRLAVLVDAYGLQPDDYEELVDAIVESGRAGMHFVRSRLEAGELAFVHAWEPHGGIRALDQILTWLVSNEAKMLAALRQEDPLSPTRSRAPMAS
ncbi:phosphotransferase [Conexibacter sp. DBS9H8]|uniref:phosphotransferase n=1 Tax=Conexibacter sp. DBS9H8 TaxID=2937801 RepID=UPI002010059B|nr:phosphotransferase [Conexibacter sp. DBS9H8]